MTEVTITLKDVRFEMTMTYVIKNAEPRPASRRGRTYRPDSLRVHYSRKEGEPWKFETGKLSGSLLKNDGTSALNGHQETLWRFDAGKWPTWVRTVIDSPPQVES